MGKKLVVCFDGTWNKPDEKSDGKESNTNVARLYNSIKGIKTKLGKVTSAKDGDTVKWYDSGVGTKWYEHIRGGAFGYGLSLNIRQGYKFLIDQYAQGDEIYIFGFSRGAYTARSLVGLIRNSGLLDKAQILKAEDPKYNYWRKPSTSDFMKLKPDDIPHIMDAYQLYRNRDGSADTDFAIMFRDSYAHKDVRIKLLGLWDTVGALGIPFKLFESFNAEQYKFHDQELSGIVEYAYHAVAIDEHRENYDVTLWNPRQKVNQTIEQVWFVGAHADVGGGYEALEHPLSDATLAWMQEKARLNGKGLDIPALQPVDETKLATFTPTDSYNEFLGGVYRRIKDRHFREIGKTTFGNESLSPVVKKIIGYSPKNPGYAKTDTAS
ncbi:Uncharacterized alpha/beta hydrolase domain [Syntrophus gentianae]|uniref:Uncharacterized alpha/beta hydrolase domain n=1 Tax=Syntrophus gentianae TaxID=43775 RepID=A0A1H7WRA1_9BACT|nr:DUF2235 domain-containing protein [Syntrophus gentianae]SEM23509.1 Uncharacterized alpha/beta hydrolase domain [Syntrophus gentianae]